MGCPGGREHDLIFTRAFRANLSLSFPRKKCNEKKIIVPSLAAITIAFFPRNMH